MKRIVAGLLTAVMVATAGEFDYTREQIVEHSIKQEAGGEIFYNPEKPKQKPGKKKQEDPRLKYLIMRKLSAEIMNRDKERPSMSKAVKITTTTQPAQGQNQPQQTTAESQPESIFTEGFCAVPNDVKVSLKPAYYTFPCVLDKLKNVQVFGELVPDASTRMLTFKPMEVRKDNEIYVVVKGFSLSGDKTSPNIASIVDEKQLEKILADTTTTTVKEVANAYEKYYENKNKTVSVVYGGTTVETNKYPSDYPLVMGLISLGKGLVEGVANMVNEEVKKAPAVFTIKAGSSIYLQLQLEKFDPSKLNNNNTGEVRR